MSRYAVALLAVLVPATYLWAQPPAAPMSSAYGWPADADYLYKISGGLKTPTREIPGEVDLAAQRVHAWNLLAAITLPSNPSDEASAPIFHTWYTSSETFNKTAQPRPGGGNGFVKLELEPTTQMLQDAPRPLNRLLTDKGVTLDDRFDPDLSKVKVGSRGIESIRKLLELKETEGKKAIDRSIDLASFLEDSSFATFSHVAFNQELYDFIRQNKYYDHDVLDELSDPDRVRKPIKAPPRRAMSLKFTWWPVAADKPVPVPVWDNDPRFAGDSKNPPNTWKRVVAVDPTGEVTSIEKIQLGRYEHSDPDIVGLDRFYHVKLSEAEVAEAMANWRLKRTATEILGREMQEGDYVVMLAMHINTVEYAPWVFATYWWHDKPNAGKWAENRTDKVKGVWKNYLMGAAFNINEPREPGGEAFIIQNPYLELFQTGGTRSNCMACHSRAAYHPEGLDARYNPEVAGTDDPNGFDGIPDGEDDPAFRKGTIDLRRIWTIKTRGR